MDFLCVAGLPDCQSEILGPVFVAVLQLPSMRHAYPCALASSADLIDDFILVFGDDWLATLAHGSPGHGTHLLVQHRISTGQGPPYSIQQRSRNLFTSKGLERGVAARLIFKLRITLINPLII